MNIMHLNRSLVLTALVASASAVHAGIPVYTDEASFLADLNDPYITEGYETYTPDLANGARSIGLDLFGVSYDGSSTFDISDETNAANGVVPVAGTQHLRSNYGGAPTVSITFTFSEAISGFGTYISDVDFGTLRYEVFLDNGNSFLGFPIDPTGNGGQTYFGIQPLIVGIEAVTFYTQDQTFLEDIFFDQTTITVPAPGAASLLTVGLLAVRRRR
jgi:hypothetical protein